MFCRHGPWRGEAAAPGGEIENLFHFFSFWSPSRREIGLSLRQYFVQSWETLNTVDWRLFDSHQWPGRLHLNTKYYLLCPALVRPLVLVVDPAEKAMYVASVPAAAAVLPGEVGDDDGDREGDHQHARQRAHPAHYLAQHRVRHHVPVPDTRDKYDIHM